MTSGFGLEAGLRALTAARLGLQTAGNNVSNANTPGFSRQRVDLSSAAPLTIAGGFQVGTGVAVDDITRLVDEGLERRIRLQLGMFGSAEVDQAHYAELEGVFGEPDNGLSSAFSEFFGAANRLQTDPSDRALRGGLVQNGASLAQGFNLLSQRFDNLASNTFSEVGGLVRQVNAKAHEVARINGQIISLEANGHAANDLRDTREQLVKEIAKMIDTNAMSRGSGSEDLLVGGHLLVSGDRVSELRVTRNDAGRTQVVIGSGNNVRINEGRIAGLLAQEGRDIPGLQASMDQLAHNFILEMNRLHTTGMPGSGPFRALASHYGAVDGNGDGTAGDELLGQSGFLFDVQAGELSVSVTNLTTGALERTRIAIDPSAMTLRDVASAIGAIDHLSASVDPTGRLRVNADAGYGFDFSPRVDPNPDGFGSFGGNAPTIGSTAAGPYDLSGQTFPVSFTVNTGTATAPTPTTVTLDSTDFANPAAATAEELATAISADLGSAGSAAAVGGRLVIRSALGGSSSQLQLANVGAGTVLADLRLSTAAATGQDNPVTVQLEGAYNGSSNGQLVFAPLSDGQIGVTTDLRVGVYDGSGNLVTTLDIGSGYTPGTALDLGNGVSVRFGAGSVSATAGNTFAFDTITDSDTSDLLVALGMNSFFYGSTASDMAVNDDLTANPDLVAAGLSGAAGDAGNLLRVAGLRETKLDDLSTNSVEDFYADVVGNLGFQAAAAEQTVQSQDSLLQMLQGQRDSVSGVNIDEEMVDMVKYQQAFDAAARFISTVQQLSNTLMNLGA